MYVCMYVCMYARMDGRPDGRTGFRAVGFRAVGSWFEALLLKGRTGFRALWLRGSEAEILGRKRYSIFN